MYSLKIDELNFKNMATFTCLRTGKKGFFRIEDQQFLNISYSKVRNMFNKKQWDALQLPHYWVRTVKPSKSCGLYRQKKARAYGDVGGVEVPVIYLDDVNYNRLHMNHTGDY